MRIGEDFMFFSKTTDFLVGREHRLVRDYLMVSCVMLVGATSLGYYLSRATLTADPMPVASIGARTEANPRIYSMVRSVLEPDGQSRKVMADRSIDPNSTGEPGGVTGSLGDELRRVTIDPCTGKQKP
jgi:hypothetical protein